MDNNTESTSLEPRAKRHKGNKKTTVFEHLKQLKEKGLKNKYEVDDVNHVYEVVDEKEYTKKVWERQDDDWIVDDDGSGYVEDGRDIFDDDLDSESIVTSNKEVARKKKKNVSKLAGKGNIQAMLSNMPEKKKKVVNLDEDDILSDILSGIDEKPSTSTSKTPKMNRISFISSEEQLVKNYMKDFCKPSNRTFQLKKRNSTPRREKPNADITILKELPVENNISELVDEVYDTRTEASVKNIKIEDIRPTESNHDNYDDFTFDDDFNVDDVQESKVQQQNGKISTLPSEITEENLISGWETMQRCVINEEEKDEENTVFNDSDLPLDKNSNDETVLNFFWWDAYEDEANQPGTVFLLGKIYIESLKSYASCCVVVKNIERKIFLLPRPFHCTAPNNGTETNVPVKLIDVYHEFNNDFAERLNIEQFRSRKVTRKYAFDPEVPQKSDYLEIRYSAKNRPLDKESAGKTFSRIFGTETSFLELLLLERKIKGPCWLEIRNVKMVTNPLSWCKYEVNCTSATDVHVISANEQQQQQQQRKAPPPLVVATINMRTVNRNTQNEIVMIGCLVHNRYCIDKQPPDPFFQQHFCVFSKPFQQSLPLDIYESLKNYKATQVQKCDTEESLLNFFLTRFAKIDPDLVVGHDLLDFQLSVLCSRIEDKKIAQWSRFGKLKRSVIPNYSKKRNNIMSGRLVCDMKVSSRELIKSRSYDLDTLCETVLKLKEGSRPILAQEHIPRMFEHSEHLLKLISLTMEDAAYITKMMYELNVLPLALQITNIAGNVLSQTLQGGRAQRNEYLLLHAFFEKDYIVPDKQYNRNKSKVIVEKSSSRKKPTYSGGLVLDPKIGFYDKLILLMDFNSLYPSIIQEYNICFTTMMPNLDMDTMLSTASTEPGILPIEIKKLVESRRQVKKLMSDPDICNELRMRYNIRQLALKLTANSMYGCLGFENSRFFAKHLASLITMKGRDILLHTKNIVQNLGFNVIYGDTDSIMINTNIVDYNEVFKIGNDIKKKVNKCYRQIELDIDGVFKYMLLLKKKKYAALTMSKNKNGEITLHQEHKGLDIVRRDWSMIASEVGKMILNHILSEQTPDERIENVQTILSKIASDLKDGKVPLQMLVITKQLSKHPSQYTEKNVLSHVQVALRYNKKGGKPLKQGDTVPYVICKDGTNAAATQRAYHIEELKNSNDLEIDINYYLSLQIHPVVSRLCEPIEGLDAYYIANALGLDPSGFKQIKPKSATVNEIDTFGIPVKKFLNVEPFRFVCLVCKETNTVSDVISKSNESCLWLEKCGNNQCKVNPIDYIHAIENQMVLSIRNYIQNYYKKFLICEDPLCSNETSAVSTVFVGKYPVCNMCRKGVMYRKYSEKELYDQLLFYKHICDISKVNKNTVTPLIDNAYQTLRNTTEKFLLCSGYSEINLTSLFKSFIKTAENIETEYDEYQEDDDEEDYL